MNIAQRQVIISIGAPIPRWTSPVLTLARIGVGGSCSQGALPAVESQEIGICG